MSLFLSDYDIDSEELNPGSNSSKTIFSSIANSSSISKTVSTIFSKINESSVDEQNETNNYFLEINTKNFFKINCFKDFTELDNKINKALQIDPQLELNMANAYLNILFPKCNQDTFSISQSISKILYSNQKKKINKEIENQIDFFVKNIKKMKNNILLLDLNNVILIGYILHSSYNIFKSYNIDNIQKFKKAIDDISSNDINIYKDYEEFCVERKNLQKKYSIAKFISKRKNKYCLPCELIFLIKYLNNINILDINFEELKLKKNDLYLYILTLINIQIIFPKINSIKINLINFQFQSEIYSRFFRLEKESLKKTNKYIKSFNNIVDKNFFQKKWDFFNVFYVQEKKVSNIKTSNNSELKLDLMNEKIHINEIINNSSNIMASILITFYIFFEFNNMNKLELVINDSYTYEFQYFLKKYCLMDISPSFHILNFLKKKDNIKYLNIELNMLDYMTCKKIFYLIHNNFSLTELQISFFSSDASYLPQTIYKFYSQYTKKENKIYFIEEPETEMLNYINKYFEKNINLLFDIVVGKKNLTKLGFFIEVPSILINNQKYMILILKFIINIIFLLDDDNSKINTLTLLSPFTVLDKSIFPSIDDYFEELEINEKNQNLLNLNLRMKIYKIVNIKKLISKNLIILNIGDFDLISFEVIIDYLISYKFCFNSKMRYLTIGLLKSIIDYNQKIHELFNKLFSIKMEGLYELNIYSNLIIDNKEKYVDLINILNYRWFSSSTLIFNNISTKTLEECKDYRRNIDYLIPIFIDRIKSDNNKNNNVTMLYLHLKFMVFKIWKEKKFKGNLNDILDKIIYGILKYLCCERKMTISHNLVNDINLNN